MFKRHETTNDKSRADEPTVVITVRMPSSLHGVLIEEANAKQTSMNRLCLSKLVADTAEVNVLSTRDNVAAAWRLLRVINRFYRCGVDIKRRSNDEDTPIRTVTRRRGDATIRATWDDGLVMMFGTTYRTWWDQLDEYCRLFRLDRPSIDVSCEPWIGFGGLKWCPWDDFQDQLDIEHAGRKVSDFAFRRPTPIERNCLRTVIRRSVSKSSNAPRKAVR